MLTDIKMLDQLKLQRGDKVLLKQEKTNCYYLSTIFLQSD